MEQYEKKGYLHDDFRIFHLKDTEAKDYSYHYHDFHKILLLLSGNISYTIEGKNYELEPYDMVFVHAGEIHRPVVHDQAPYERLIIYVSETFLTDNSPEDASLAYCLQKASEEHSNVLRLPFFEQSKLCGIYRELSASLEDRDFACLLYQKLLFLEFLIELNRSILHRSVQYREVNSSNEKIMEVLHYVNSHLTEDLSPDLIAGLFFVNKYYLMHLFKSETGYTLGSYLTNKRLLLARQMLQKNIPATQVCFDCGFKNYSTFSRAYKKCFQDIPRNAAKKNAAVN